MGGRQLARWDVSRGGHGGLPAGVPLRGHGVVPSERRRNHDAHQPRCDGLGGQCHASYRCGGVGACEQRGGVGPQARRTRSRRRAVRGRSRCESVCPLQICCRARSVAGPRRGLARVGGESGHRAGRGGLLPQFFHAFYPGAPRTQLVPHRHERIRSGTGCGTGLHGVI